jgi:P-type E1-E2 ATPase
LIDLFPSTKTVRRDGDWKDVEVQQVSVGEEVLVRPGARIPVDGTVIGGHSFVDQAPITGESIPVEKIARAAVFAGTINQSGALEVRVDRLGRDTTFGKIIEAVERAEKSRAPIQGIAESPGRLPRLLRSGSGGCHFSHPPTTRGPPSP